MIWLYSLSSVIIVSLFSLIGIVTIGIKEKLLQKILIYFVAFSVGALLGGSFLHLLPEAVNEAGSFTLNISLSIFLSFVFFFLLEKILRWRHCHEIGCDDHPKYLGGLNLIGDAFHNFIDGVLIGISFLVSIPLGIATTTAVILHEIPQELGDFGVLLHSGYTKKRAMFFNFLSACVAIVGTAFALLLGERAENFADFMIPFAAGGFMYIALSDLIPELHKERKFNISFLQLFFAVLGVSVMYLMKFLD